MPNVALFPSSDGALLAWSLKFSTGISAAAVSLGLSVSQASAYAALHTAFATALAACDPDIRTKSATANKNQARTNLKNSARLLSSIIEGQATVTDAQKIALGLNVRAHPTPIPPPSVSPIINVVSQSAWTLRVKLKAPDSTKRGLPSGCIGATLFSYVGATPPTDLAAWKFEANVGKTDLNIVFDNALPSGTKVFLTAFYFNGRKESGAACVPVPAVLPGGSVSSKAA